MLSLTSLLIDVDKLELVHLDKLGLSDNGFPFSGSAAWSWTSLLAGPTVLSLHRAPRPNVYLRSRSRFFAFCSSMKSSRQLFCDPFPLSRRPSFWLAHSCVLILSLAPRDSLTSRAHHDCPPWAWA